MSLNYAEAPAAEYLTRSSEVPDASWTSGCNVPGLNAPGIGINIGGGAIVGTPEQFTLLDQNGDARNPQKSGGVGMEPQGITNCVNDAGGLGAVTTDGAAYLLTLAAGWTKTNV